MLVVKFCEKLLRSCGINNFVAVSDIPAFCLDNKLPTTSNMELVTVHLSPDQAVWVQGLGRDIVSCSWTRHCTLTVPLST